MKKGYKVNIETETTANTNFRRVLYTGHNTQLVLMSIAPGSEIGSEVHPDNDQFFRFEAGHGRVTIDETVYEVGDGDVVIVPAGSEHNVENASDSEPLQLYTLYSPPHHKDGIVRATKEEAEANEADFDGVTTE
ncbi:cupin domain-containing protein [Candidatus Saccharibacteria bacterium]|nr:cupin domain-containing protein [Candidatus Saccharibacteria bacterium]